MTASANCSVLASPPDFTTVEMLNTETLVNAISLYRSLFDYIVIDTRTSFDEATLQILDVADRIVLLDTGAALSAGGRLSAVCAETGQLLQVDRAGNHLDAK